MQYSSEVCNSGKCKNVRNGDGRHCHIYALDRKRVKLLSINDWRIRLAFGATYGFFLGIYILTWWNDDKETTLTFFGTLFSITGVFVAVLVAYWAIEVESSKKRQQKEENKYYKMNLIADLYGLIMQIKIAYHWDAYQKADEDKREEMNADIAKSIKESEATIFGWCSDIQMINLNSYAPPDIKTRVSMIIRTAQKTNWNITGVVEEVFRRVDDLLNTDYMKDIKDGSVIQWVRDIKRNIGKLPNS